MAKAAFRRDANAHVAGSALKAAWWVANGLATRALVRPERGTAAPEPARVEPAGEGDAGSRLRPGALRRRWLEAFAKDRADVAAGLYPVSEEPPSGPGALMRRSIDLLRDAKAVDARRLRADVTEAKAEADSPAYPVYYRQNFHFQSGGWFTQASASRYETQVETLFAGAAGPMRRRALSLLMKALRGRDQRRLSVVDAACGSGAFLRDLAAALPRALVVGVDLSGPYLAEARMRSGAASVQANVERLPFAEGSLDALTCIFLFHELPPRVRPRVAAELARALKPGGLLAFADSVQASDAPELGRMLRSFPALFHEPYFGSYQQTDLPALFGAAGLRLIDQDSAFLTKALLFEKI